MARGKTLTLGSYAGDSSLGSEPSLLEGEMCMLADKFLTYKLDMTLSPNTVVVRIIGRGNPLTLDLTLTHRWG